MGDLLWFLLTCGVQNSFLAVEPFVLNTHTHTQNEAQNDGENELKREIVIIH